MAAGQCGWQVENSRLTLCLQDNVHPCMLPRRRLALRETDGFLLIRVPDKPISVLHAAPLGFYSIPTSPVFTNASRTPRGVASRTLLLGSVWKVG